MLEMIKIKLRILKLIHKLFRTGKDVWILPDGKSITIAFDNSDMPSEGKTVAVTTDGNYYTFDKSEWIRYRSFNSWWGAIKYKYFDSKFKSGRKSDGDMYEMKVYKLADAPDIFKNADEN